MSANQSGYTECFADGSEASPSIQIGRLDTGFYVERDSAGVPIAIRTVVAGVSSGGVVAAASAPVDAVAASSTLTSTNVNPGDTKAVTIGSKTYTFKTALTPTEGEVLIGGSADATLLNLINAINHTGTPDTDYSCAAAHPTVSAASSVTSHAFAVTALTKGTAGNAIVTSDNSAELSFTGATLAGGIDGTTGAAGDIVIYSAQPYICTADATVATSGAWKKLSTAAL